jgi:signal transduction histidine kinase
VAAQALASGAYGYLSKPYLPDEIYIAVLNALRRQELELQSLRNRELLERTVRQRTMELAESLCELQEAQQDLKAKAEQLQALNTMKTEFIQLVSHELHTPLTVIKGGVQTVLRYGGRMEPALQEQLLSSVQSNAERLGWMIEKLLVAGAIGQNGLDENQGPFRLDEVVAEAISEAVPDPARKVTVRLTESTAIGDRNLIKEAIRDLVENAVVHTEGRVTVATWQGVSDAVVTVSDEGPTPSPEFLTRLFTEPFVQADASTTRSIGGLGLSLYLARRIVEASSGQLTVERVGTGSAFSITLPRAE